MPLKVSDLTTRIRESYPDCSVTIAERLVNQVNDELHERFPVKVEQRDVPLILNKAEYPFPQNSVVLWNAEYYSSSTADPKPLTATEVSLVETERRNWRSATAGEPREYYVWADPNGAVWGVIPKPNTTASAGFVRLYVSKLPEVLGANDYLPNNLPRNAMAYENGACLKWAIKRDRDAIAMYKQLYEADLVAIAKGFSARNIQVLPRAYPRTVRSGFGGVV